MKKLMIFSFALALLMSGLALAQDSMNQDGVKPGAATATASVTGMVSDDGKTFVNDQDGKSWTINNPDSVKGHEGHHVTLQAHLDSDKNEIHVTSLKMAKDAA